MLSDSLSTTQAVANIISPSAYLFNGDKKGYGMIYSYYKSYEVDSFDEYSFARSILLVERHSKCGDIATICGEPVTVYGDLTTMYGELVTVYGDLTTM